MDDWPGKKSKPIPPPPRQPCLPWANAKAKHAAETIKNKNRSQVEDKIKRAMKIMKPGINRAEDVVPPMVAGGDSTSSVQARLSPPSPFMLRAPELRAPGTTHPLLLCRDAAQWPRDIQRRNRCLWNEEEADGAGRRASNEAEMEDERGHVAVGTELDPGNQARSWIFGGTALLVESSPAVRRNTWVRVNPNFHQTSPISRLRYVTAYFHILGPNFERPDLSQIRELGHV